MKTTQTTDRPGAPDSRPTSRPDSRPHDSLTASLFTRPTVLCDGAMGTMLYSCGVFINRCYDELNLTQPELVRSVHEQYLQAGAQIIETNTFGANAFRLEHFGLRDKVADFNRAGVAIARQCVNAIRDKQGTEAFVAGAVGSLGLQLTPTPNPGPPATTDQAATSTPLASRPEREARSGETRISTTTPTHTTPEAARAAFAEQIAALADAGVDLLILETMMSVAEAEQAVLAARDVAPHLRIAALFTVGEDSLCLDGQTPEAAAQRMAALGVDAVGCNCSVGPQIVLSTIERMRSVTALPLVAMPNAGIPRTIEGRAIYLTSPEYLASFARKFVRAGANWVGGCCGTTPAHIRAMRGALRAMQAQDAGEAALQTTSAPSPTNGSTPHTAAARAESALTPAPLAQRSTLGRRIATGEFVTMVEIVPPKGFDCSRELAGAQLLASRGVHAINVPDSPRASARMSAQSLCVQIERQVGIETVLHSTCRDRNILSIQSDLLGAASIGLRNILCLTGDPPKMGNYPDATAVFDVDAIGLTRIVRDLNRGLDIGGNSIGASAGFTISVAANPGVPDIDHEMRRLAYKVEAGAEFCITQPVFDLALLERFLRRLEAFRIPVIAGIWPLTSLRNAEVLKNDLRVSMPDAILRRMAEAPSKEAALAEGVAIAQQMLAGVRSQVQGVQVSAPFGKYAVAADVLGLPAQPPTPQPTAASNPNPDPAPATTDPPLAVPAEVA